MIHHVTFGYLISWWALAEIWCLQAYRVIACCCCDLDI